ncbi:MAG: hypothetical protein AAB568_00625 [Patescibacteria group bacterium]
MREPKASVPSLVDFLSSLSYAQQVALTDNRRRERIVNLLDALIGEEAANTFFTIVNDPDVPARLAETGANWRKLASDIGHDGPVAWSVKHGFTLKKHAPEAGPCYEKWAYLQNWNLKNDEPTADSLVFFIPRIVGTTWKYAQEQVGILADLRKQYQLPENHLTSFGSAALLAGLILANFKHKGERAPLNRCWVHTDTLDEGGNRLNLGHFNEAGLGCGDIRFWVNYRFGGSIGVFPLGIEPVGREYSSVVAGDYE